MKLERCVPSFTTRLVIITSFSGFFTCLTLISSHLSKSAPARAAPHVFARCVAMRVQRLHTPAIARPSHPPPHTHTSLFPQHMITHTGNDEAHAHCTCAREAQRHALANTARPLRHARAARSTGRGGGPSPVHHARTHTHHFATKPIRSTEFS